MRYKARLHIIRRDLMVGVMPPVSQDLVASYPALGDENIRRRIEILPTCPSER